MPRIEFDLSGMDALKGRLQSAPAAAFRAAAEQLYEDGEETMTDAKDNYVPVHDGILRGTGHVEQPQINGDTASVQLGFGGPAAPYAAKQHEDLTLHHTVGEAKYLERPLLQRIIGMAQRIANRARAAMSA
jgi:hypothetical protein